MVNITAAAKAAVSAYAAAVQLGGNTSIPLTEVADAMAQLYLPGFTSFTLGSITALGSDPSIGIAAQLTQYNQSGLGTDFRFCHSRIEPVSDQSAVAWLTWTLRPKNSLAPWQFTDVYGFRIAANRSGGLEGGWEWSNADDEYIKLFTHDPTFPTKRWIGI